MAIVIADSNIEKAQALAIKQGLRAIKMGRRVNRAYTPKACMATASRLTGKKFKARDYDGAIQALDEFVFGKGVKQDG